MSKIKYLEPLQTPPHLFPADPYLPEGAKELALKDDEISVTYLHDVVYAERSGERQRLQILIPSKGFMGMPDDSRWPLVVYIPGSAFMRQDNYMMLPWLIDFAKRGYVVASVEYRPSDVAPFPAHVQDTKTAIRFMRMHAREYRVDPDKIAIFGGSSGGHTAAFVGITGDEGPDTDLYGEYSANVGCIIDWFGPTAIELMNAYPSGIDHTKPDSPEGRLIGRKNVLENLELAYPVNPINYLSKDKPTPPVLIMHGDRDFLVPFNQSVLLYEKLRELGKDVEFYKLKDGSHGFMGFNSRAAYDIVDEFIRRKLNIA